MAKSNKKSIKRLSLLLGALTLGTIFLVSYTLARFTTSASSSGSSGVSTWNITITPQTNTTPPSGTTYDGAVSFGKLSPGNPVSDPENNTVTINDTTYYYLVQHTTDKIQVASLTYETDVNFTLSVESSDFTITFSDGSTLTSGTASATSTIAAAVAESDDVLTTEINSTNYEITSSHEYNGTGAIVPQASDITDLYDLTVYYSTSSTATDSMTSLGDGTEFTASTTSTTYYLYADLTWQIKVTNYSATADYYWVTYLCDWVGKYVDTVSCTLTYTADQASETPN